MKGGGTVFQTADSVTWYLNRFPTCILRILGEPGTILLWPKQDFLFKSTLQMMHGHPSLSHLTVSKHWGDHEDTLDAIGSFLSSTSILESLTLKHFVFLDGYFKHHLAQALMHAPKLSKLSLAHCSFYDSPQELFAFLQSKRGTNSLVNLQVFCGMLSSHHNVPTDMLLMKSDPMQATIGSSLQALELDMEYSGDFFEYMSANASRILVPALYVYNVTWIGWPHIVNGIPHWIHVSTLRISMSTSLGSFESTYFKDLVPAIHKNGSLREVAIIVCNQYQLCVDRKPLSPWQWSKVQSCCQRNQNVLLLLVHPDENSGTTREAISNNAHNRHIIPSLLFVLQQARATCAPHTLHALLYMGEAIVPRPGCIVGPLEPTSTASSSRNGRRPRLAMYHKYMC